jgi:hypothetical protein
MRSPVLTESPRRLEPVAPDPFIDALPGDDSWRGLDDHERQVALVRASLVWRA